MDMKYVKFEDINGCTAVVAFSPTIKHSDMVYALAQTKVLVQEKSAGFIRCNGSLETFGESVSLGLKSEKEDAKYFAMFM